MSTKLIYLKKQPLMKMIFGFSIFTLGTLIALFYAINGLILSGIGLFLIHKEGIEVNLGTKSYRSLISFGGIHFGKWKPLPNLDYVSVFKTTENVRVRAVTAEANLNNEVYKINLFYNRNKHITAYKTEEVEDALKVGIEISKTLKIDVLDATTPNQKWL